MKSSRGTILRYKADRYTVCHVLGVAAVQLAAWWFATPLVAALVMLPVLVLCMMSAPINHNHQHVNVFRSALVNRFFEIPLSLQTGIGPYGWVLHHNLGHHLNYLEQRPKPKADESRWTRHDGSTMGRFEYSVRLMLTHQVDIYRVGQRHPKIYRRHLLMKLPLYTALGVLLYLNPVNALIVYVALPFLILFHTCWVTYEHHSDLHTEDHHLASRNRISPIYNRLAQNLGYHTAHHMRPGLHWSELPAFHAEVVEKIPESLVNPAFW